MDEKQLQFLYNEYAKGKGFKDYSEFKGLMSSEGSRKLFFDDANTELGFKDYNEFNDLLGLKKKVGGEVFSPTELPSVSREYLDKGQELADASFLKKIGEPDRSQLVSQYKSPDISLTEKSKKDYYSTKLEKGLIFDKEGQLYAPSSEALSKDITAAEQASLKKSTQKDLVEKSREMPVVVEPTEPTEEQGLLLNLVSSLDRGFAKNFISNPMKGLGTFLQGTTKKVLGGSGEGDLSNALIKYGDYLNNAIDELTPQDEEFKNSLWDQAAQALGQVGSLVLTGGLTGAAGKGAALVAQAPKGAVATAASRIASQLSAPTSISAGLSMGQAEFDRAKQAGATDDQAFEVFYKNAVTGSVLETIPVMQFFKRFNKSTAGGLVNYLKTKGVAGFTGGVEEMTTEILQQVYANKTAKDIYNINQSILDGVGSSGGIGFGVGFLLNAMGANARILRKQGKEQDAIAIENQIEQYEDNLKNPKVTSGNTAKDIVTQGVEIGTQKAVQDLDRDLANNVITTEKYQEGIAFAEKAAQVADKIPETVTGESKVKSVELLVERNDIKQANQNLLQQKQTTDEAYHAGIDEEIKANEEKIKKIDSEVYDITKKPSKEFGTKKYEIDGEEVSQEAFEALTGKPIGTKTIVEPTQIGGLKVIKRVEDAGGEAVYEVEGERFLTADGKELAVSKVKIPTEVKPTEDINNVNVTIEGTTDGYKVISGDKANSIGDIRQEANEARAKGQDTFTKETVKDGKKIFTLTDTTVSDEFGRPGFKSASMSFPEGTKVTMEDVMAKLKSELGVKEVKPTEVKEVKVEEVKPEVKKSKLEAYKEKYAQKQKIEPIKIEDNGNPIIAKDPAENDIAIAKLAKQDNPVEESSIKAIEGKAEGDIKAKLNEVIAEVDDKIKLATRIEMVAMNDLKTDEASFQNREGLNLKKVDDIVANYNPSEFDPIIYWTDANGQKYTLNHHRFAAAQKLKLDEIPAQKLTYPLGHPKEFQVVPATDKAEAIDFAINRSNANRSMETAVERAKALRKLQKTGTKEEINKFLEREGKNKTKIQNIAALNENGKTIDALKMFGDAEDVQLQKETEQRSDWIGEARRRISGLTNEHENEMFDFLMDKDASKRITSKADFISKVTSLAGGFDFNPENPLNLKRFKYQTEGERAYDERTGQLKSEIDTRQTKIDDLKARFSDPSRKDYIPTDSRDYEQTKKIADDQISKLNTEIKSFQQKLQEHYKEKGKYQGGIEQGGLFATKQITTEEISDMADIVKEFYDEGVIKLDDIKKEIAKELGYNSKALKDAVEQAYNKMVMEYTPVEISKGVIGKVGEKLNELGEDGVVMLEDDESIFAKAAQLAETGGRVEFQATLPNGEKVTAKPVDASIVNGFYSPLELQINQMKADKMPAKQWLDKLRGEEAKWTGLADWLSEREGSLSKQEIKNWLQSNQIEINEIVKGKVILDINDRKLWKYQSIGDGIWNFNFKDGWFQIDASEGNGYARLTIRTDKGTNEIGVFGPYEDRNEILDGVLEDGYFDSYTEEEDDFSATKFSNYQLEGEKEDYAEILVTLPINKTNFEIVEWRDGGYVLKVNGSDYAFNESIDFLKNIQAEIENGKRKGDDAKFRSSHFDELNILVHLRMNIRKDAQGNKVLFLEEVQSDWGQTAKKQGLQSGDRKKLQDIVTIARKDVEKINEEVSEYYSKNVIKKIQLSDAEENAYANISAKMRNGIATQEEIAERNIYIQKDTFSDTQYDLAKRDKKFNDLLTIRGEKLVIMRDAIVAYDKASLGIVPAPFITDTNAWTKLALKVALKEAVKQGADKIAWTTGEQQNERYDLSKQVDEIKVLPQYSGSKMVPMTYAVIGIKNGQELARHSANTIGELEGIIGKELAKKVADKGEYEGELSFKGDDLKVGGRGMKGFYGSASEGSLGILGNMAKSLFKQEPSLINIKTKDTEKENARINKYRDELSDIQNKLDYLGRADDIVYYDDFTGERYDINKKELEDERDKVTETIINSENKLRNISYQYQYSIKITPELKAQVEVGLPLFMAKPSGDILGFTYGKTIYLNASKINPNTPIHEGGHIWTKWVKNNDPRLYDRGMELVKNSKYLERAKSSKFYQEQAAKLPQGEREAYFQEEALAMAIGDKGAQFVAEAKKSSFKEWLDNLWDAIKNAAGFDNITAKELQNLTFDEFVKRAARDILSPKSQQELASINEGMAEAYKDLTINQKRQIINSKFDELLRVLKIEKICP